MDEYFSVKEKLFVWDKAKNEANITEHGIDFYTAAYVFNDEFRNEAKTYLMMKYADYLE